MDSMIFNPSWPGGLPPPPLPLLPPLSTVVFYVLGDIKVKKGIFMILGENLYKFISVQAAAVSPN